ncbi:MAG: hypothetical protein ACOYMG_16625, partial [Candidatus Methylumidiphilus sp.]
MNIAIRTDASLQIGTGHVMRCLTLADRFKMTGAVCTFICREHPGNLLDLIRQRGHEAIGLVTDISTSSKHNTTQLAHAAWLGTDWITDAEQTRAALGDTTADWLIVDHYAL